MVKRAKGAKSVYVKRYPRWKKGKREHVKDSRRGEDHERSVRKSKKQLRLNLDDEPK